MAAIPCGKRWKNQAKPNFAIQFRDRQPRETFSHVPIVRRLWSRLPMQGTASNFVPKFLFGICRGR
jgi:hypothetical protein